MGIFIVGEIGINHNGDLDIAKKLIDVAVESGFNAVKFQKRAIEKVYTKDILDASRESPWGNTQREQKAGLEFGLNEYKQIDGYCKAKGIKWFASAWDVDSQLFLRQFNCPYNKVASAMLTHLPVLRLIAEEKKHTFISTGMSTMAEIESAVHLFREMNCPFELMHTNSSYPMREEDANLKMLQTLRDKFKCSVGYSGHEIGLTISVAAAALGATSIERHITLDRAMYGSDHSASIEGPGMHRLVRDIRIVEVAMGNGIKEVTETEKKIREKLAPWSVNARLAHPNNPNISEVA